MALSSVPGIFPVSGTLPDSCVSFYREEGWVLLKGFFDLERQIMPIHREINQLIRLKMESLGMSGTPDAATPEISNEAFLALCRQDRSKAGEIYRASRHLASLHSLLVEKQSLHLAHQLMNTAFVNVIPFVPLRIDIRGEEKYLLDWHQDYPYTQGSMDGIVLWMSLFDLGEGEGGVELIPRSHRQGLRKIVVLDPENQRKNGGNSIAMQGREALDSAQAVHFPVSAGDALVFSTLLIHKSLPMEKGTIRWTAQLRYANFADEDAIRRGWPGGMIEGSDFTASHPEYVA